LISALTCLAQTVTLYPIALDAWFHELQQASILAKQKIAHIQQ
jgi:hypothetical protein